MIYARANPSTAQANTALVEVRTNQRVLLRHIYVSSDTEQTITIVNSETHDVIWRQYVGARGGVILDDLAYWSAYGEGLDYTTSTSGNVMLIVGYNYFGK